MCLYEPGKNVLKASAHVVLEVSIKRKLCKIDIEIVGNCESWCLSIMSCWNIIKTKYQFISYFSLPHTQSISELFTNTTPHSAAKLELIKSCQQIITLRCVMKYLILGLPFAIPASLGRRNSEWNQIFKLTG